MGLPKWHRSQAAALQKGLVQSSHILCCCIYAKSKPHRSPRAGSCRLHLAACCAEVGGGGECPPSLCTASCTHLDGEQPFIVGQDAVGVDVPLEPTGEQSICTLCTLQVEELSSCFR